MAKSAFFNGTFLEPEILQESQMFDRPKRPGLAPLTPVLPDAHDRIFTAGYSYFPVHTEIYGTYRSVDTKITNTSMSVLTNSIETDDVFLGHTSGSSTKKQDIVSFRTKYEHGLCMHGRSTYLLFSSR